MKAFGDYIQNLRRKRGLSIEKVKEKTQLSVHNLRNYEQGRRKIPFEALSPLREALCELEEERHEFDRLAQVGWPQKAQSIFELPIDSKAAYLRVCPLNYAPFSGADSRFVDQFITKMLDLAMISFQVPTVATAEMKSKAFDIATRIHWLESNQADLLINLISLQRMKKIVFLPTPIRISLNGVILKSAETQLLQARAILSGEKTLSREAFKLLAIQNEVGHVYLSQMRTIADAYIFPLQTLDAEKLAEAMKKEKEQQSNPLLVCDEITALSVVRELKGDGSLVFQLSTDQAVAESGKRRITPAHLLGIGLSRANTQLIAYLSEALSMFLLSETETISVMYQKLYSKLVDHVKICLQANSSYYVRGLRRVSKSEIGEATDSVFLDQSARAYARRCLQLSRRSQANMPPELQMWTKVLARTRERVQIADATDRRQIKAVIVGCAKTILGIDPAGANDLLTYEQFKESCDINHWSQFKSALEYELDTDLPFRGDVLADIREGNLEDFVSRIQRLMEVSAQTASATSIIEVKQAHKELYGDLRRSYRQDMEKQREDAPRDLRLQIELNDQTADDKVLVAVNLGEPVGFIEAIVEVSTPALDVKRGKGLRIKHIFVVEHMRSSGISRRLIRSIIEIASKNGYELVWLRADRYPDEICAKFERCGFNYLRKAHLFYRLEGIKVQDAAVGSPQTNSQAANGASSPHSIVKKKR
jgi:GNAT superfamily N-acetyltransferase/transcriptional regulator with XRE-family HTH domain